MDKQTGEPYGGFCTCTVGLVYWKKQLCIEKKIKHKFNKCSLHIFYRWILSPKWQSIRIPKLHWEHYKLSRAYQHLDANHICNVSFNQLKHSSTFCAIKGSCIPSQNSNIGISLTLKDYKYQYCCQHLYYFERKATLCMLRQIYKWHFLLFTL